MAKKRPLANLSKAALAGEKAFFKGDYNPTSYSSHRQEQNYYIRGWLYARQEAPKWLEEQKWLETYILPFTQSESDSDSKP